MTTDEIVRALRCVQEKHRNDRLLTFQTDVSAMAMDAADLVESLQAQLAASQRREKAAVEDLKRFSACCQCNANIDGSCCDMFDGTAENKYFCSNWQWRGPQEAGEEATE